MKKYNSFARALEQAKQAVEGTKILYVSRMEFFDEVYSLRRWFRNDDVLIDLPFKTLVFCGKGKIVFQRDLGML